MFATLVVSRPSARPRARFLVSAALVHAAILSAAVEATTSDPLAPAPVRRDTIILFPRPDQIAIHDDPNLPGPAPRRFRPGPPVFGPAPSLPEGLEIPPLVLPDIGNWLAGALAGTANDTARGPSGTERPFAELDVDQPPTRVSGPEPRYPPALERAGVSGRVEVSFVIAVSGMVDSASFKVLHADHPGFVAAVREAILASRFTPGRRHGKPVSVFVTQVVGFQQ